ncbi:Cytochrome c551 peroxidase [Vibrio nigripulchritudo SFn27]|uniref:Cytochrome c551 peroxidase n=1 Tax=Vibrio nigripulchritudo TaxID=28173 RepID=U4K323_9VIBR|nr:Cytochrome c551 peroxidase [Vibrio nigripulchritudo BLFn1]CCN91299.1 Cytochrome c551 peroxidase [Vibrio nigripulchritudo SFn27]CCN92616.1 Cytochrome c551 peroxidase [Vibrio nigripulchritudo ENn2]CCO41020.1 Cytochrome c551 peroxidase [Vibrio nigripulchritudo SFn135]CCO50565.1 Cytochrome c551 peroxidase [Vibrio nigripulchritudo Wn13]CCO59666.1 Cytochrome c551 peroxidase [Vibrio nigripulchritudo]
MKIKTLVTLSALSLSVQAQVSSQEPVQAIEPVEGLNPSLVKLGKKLWFDPRLSKSNAISCNSCHNLATGGVDNLPSSIGHGWQIGPINSPTVLNAELNFVQFWNGRAEDLKAQAAGPIENPKEMAFTHTLAVDTIKSIPGYQALFKEAFGKKKFDIDEVTIAIAEFEKTLRTPNAPFDLWLKGDKTALTDTQKEGYALFKQKGCTACHAGPLLGGQMYQKMGLVKPFETNNPDEGRKAITGNDFDRFVFKVPTLRNVELTYPYFHDGSEWDLKQAVKTMADIQLGQPLTDGEATKITEFLKSLTGDQPKVVLPALPPSTVNTPRPDVG